MADVRYEGAQPTRAPQVWPCLSSGGSVASSWEQEASCEARTPLSVWHCRVCLPVAAAPPAGPHAHLEINPAHPQLTRAPRARA